MPYLQGLHGKLWGVMIMDLLGVPGCLFVQEVTRLLVVKEVESWGLLLLLCNLPQHVVDQPFFFVSVTLAVGRRREAVLGRFQHAVAPLFHLKEEAGSAAAHEQGGEPFAL